jgi:hypothetical protein
VGDPDIASVMYANLCRHELCLIASAGTNVRVKGAMTNCVLRRDLSHAEKSAGPEWLKHIPLRF